MIAMADQSEFSYGSGLMAPQGRGHVPTPFERLRAMRLTDPSNPNANEENVLLPNVSQTGTDEDGRYLPGDQKSGSTPMVVETGGASATGQHKPIDPGKWNKDHYADGFQDGSGEAWRQSMPPNPVT